MVSQASRPKTRSALSRAAANQNELNHPAPRALTLCERFGRHDFIMAPDDPSVDECTRCKVRRH